MISVKQSSLRLRATWLLLQFIALVVLMGLIFRTVIISDHTQRQRAIQDKIAPTVDSTFRKVSIKKTGADNNFPPKPAEDRRRIKVELTKSDAIVDTTTDGLVDILQNDTSPPLVCRRRLLELWTRNDTTALPNNSFPVCSALFRSLRNGTMRDRNLLFAKAQQWTVPGAHTTNSILDMLWSCDYFRRNVDFPDKPATKLEAEFPLAFVFVPFRNLAQTVRLFRMIYQPQNTYCINYDTKSEENYKKAIIKLASCFPNVYLNPNPEPIYYAKFGVLHSVMECLNVLRRSERKWEYVQVVSWNDIPLKTNWEMVKIFKALNGSQDCELTDNDQPIFVTYQAHETPFKHTGVRRPVPPNGITIYKGSFATSMSREFIHWMFTDPVAVRFYQYYDNTTICAEEFYWASLIHNVQLNPPGGYPGQCFIFFQTAKERKPFLSRYQVWKFRTGPERRCRGKYTHSSCVFGIRDIHALMNRMELFGHKLYEEFQPALLYCMEEWYWERVCMGDTGLGMFYYENLPSVLYHGLPQKEKDRYICNTW